MTQFFVFLAWLSGKVVRFAPYVYFIKFIYDIMETPATFWTAFCVNLVALIIVEVVSIILVLAFGSAAVVGITKR